jgi:hypothetical protein
MSNRQVKKILQRKGRGNQDGEEESEGEEEKKVNFFGDVEVEELSSDSEEGKQPTVSTRNVARDEKKKGKKEEDFVFEVQENEDPVPEVVLKTESVFKRHLHCFDPSAETQQLFKEERKSKKSSHRSGKKLALTPNIDYYPSVDYLLAMERVSDPSRNIYFFDISKGYAKLQPSYIECVETNDPNALNQFLQRYPFHIEALFQMCMVFQMQGNYEQVGVILERMLHSFQLSFHHQFSVLSSDAEIDVGMNSFNRIFYKTLMMHADCLGRKGCVRTALEVVKLVLSLSPTQDPMGCIFLIDYYAIRAKKFRYLQHFMQNFMKEVYGHGCALVFPNLVYSLALAKAIQTGYTECREIDIQQAEAIEKYSQLFEASSSVVLLCAVKWHPGLAKGLLKKIGGMEATDEEIGKIGQIYAARTEEIWKPHIGWLKKVFGLNANVKEQENEFEGILDRYLGLDRSDFSFDVRTVIPQEMEVGRPQRRGNLSTSLHPIYLFFATLLPWNYID